MRKVRRLGMPRETDSGLLGGTIRAPCDLPQKFMRARRGHGAQILGEFVNDFSSSGPNYARSNTQHLAIGIRVQVGIGRPRVVWNVKDEMQKRERRLRLERRAWRMQVRDGCVDDPTLVGLRLA